MWTSEPPPAGAMIIRKVAHHPLVSSYGRLKFTPFSHHLAGRPIAIGFGFLIIVPSPRPPSLLGWPSSPTYTAVVRLRSFRDQLRPRSAIYRSLARTDSLATIAPFYSLTDALLGEGDSGVELWEGAHCE